MRETRTIPQGRWLASMLAVLLIGSTAQGDWAALQGEAAPALEIESWLAAPEGETLAALRGSVVALLLPGAVDLADARAVTHWNDVRAGWWAKGLRVIAVVPEASGELPPNVEFSVAVGKADAYGTGTGPRALLIAADGKVAWEGEPRALTDALIAKLVRKTKTFVIEGSGEAEKAFRKGKLAAAQALTLVAGETTPVGLRVAALLGYWTKQAARAEAAQCIGEASACLKRITKHFSGAPSAEGASQKLKLLKGQKNASKEISNFTAYAKLRQDLAKALGNTKKITGLVKKAERVAKKKPATKSVERAARMVVALRADPGVTALKDFIAKQRIKTTSSNWRKSLPKPPEVEFESSKSYLWHLETNQGDITLRFLVDDAPMHVSNAIYLTLLGFYDGLIFQRVIPGFMAQGGCPDGSGSGQIGYRFGGEFDGDAKHDRLGILSAANSGPGTDSSHFFITFDAAAHLNGKHTIYGVLVKGEGTLKKMEKLGSQGGQTSGEIRIEKATITVE